jgi:hypothetical protein
MFRVSFRGSVFCGVEAGGHSEKRRRRKASSFMAGALGAFWKEEERKDTQSGLMADQGKAAAA